MSTVDYHEITARLPTRRKTVAMTITSADVARYAGLSRATVSQVLNGHAHRFAADTAERVLRAAEELGYQPSAAGRMLRSGSSDFVIALVPNTTFGGNLQDIFDTVTDLLAQRGLTLGAKAVHAVPGIPGPHLGRHAAAGRAVASALLRRGEGGAQGARRPRLRHHVRRKPQLRDRADSKRSTSSSRGYRRLAFAHLRDSRQDPYGTDREVAVADVCAAAGLAAPVDHRPGH